MSEIQHTQLAEFLKASADASLPAVYLIHGQEMLVERSAEQLSSFLLSGESADLCCEKIEGLVENVTDALERLNTFSLLAGPKIVLFKEAKLFEGRHNQQKWVDKIVDARNEDDEHQAAKYFFNLCGQLDINLESIHHGMHKNAVLKNLIAQIGNDNVEKMVNYCQSQGWQAVITSSHIDVLQKAIKNGFPPCHYLITTVYSKVPKNLKLYKSFRDHGVVIDCNIPLGERRADKDAQEKVLHRTLDELLSKSGKQLAPRAFKLLCEFTGFDPRVFVQNIEKLIDYVGDRIEIGIQDIHAVLKQTKVDPVFTLTNAVAERNISQSLNYLNTLLEASWHPLQILSALANQMRKLLIAKSFLSSEDGNCWDRAMRYPQFKNQVMPAIETHDNFLREKTKGWMDTFCEQPQKGVGGKKGSLDVIVATNPKSPYPVYQTILKAENYTIEELVEAMIHLNHADLRLKSTGQDADMVLKMTLMDICGKKHV